MKDLEKLARRLYRFFETELDTFSSGGDGAWIIDNKNRILSLSASLSRLREPRLPKGSGNARVFELAQEMVEQSDGAVSGDTVRLTRTFALTFAEFDFLPAAIMLNELRLLEKIIKDPQTYLHLAPNCVKTLITFSELDFCALRTECLEQESVLLRDRVYDACDEATRAQYRLRAARIAKKSRKTETEICAMALDQNDVTDAFFGPGTALLFQRLGLRPPRKISVALYLCAGFLPAFILCGAFFSAAPLPALLSLVPLCVVSFRLFHRFLLRHTSARRPFRMKESCLDSPDYKTAVVQTVLLPGLSGVQKALDALEEYAAGNPLRHGVYLILADLKESQTETDGGDEAILLALKDGIARLNRVYGEKFAALVRPRVPHEGRFTGRERKRGALEDLVQFLHDESVVFRLAVNAQALKGTAYICTLDADTVLPPGSLARLLCAAAHPFNRGYGLFQPRIDTLPLNSTPFARLFASPGGLDAYDTPAREVFQDVFASGSFCGKGLFSVEAYRARVSGKIRPNTVLSHDLLEGELLHTLAENDVSFYDAFPQEPIAFYKRRERWLRGDWLLVRYLFGPPGALSKWKILWNLLLSLFPVGVLAQICAGFFCARWTVVALLLPLAELLLPVWEVYGDALRFDRGKHVFGDKRDERLHRVAAAFVSALFLPFDAFDSCRAIARTVVRMIRGRRILEWTPFSSVTAQDGFSACLRFFLPGALTGFLPLAFALVAGRGVAAAALLALLWSLIPWYAFLLGKKDETARKTLNEQEEHDLRLLAVRTLRFFDDALRANGFLMPDHLQCHPVSRFAPRTSPTNIAFALLSVPCGKALCAYSSCAALELLQAQYGKIASLPRWHGHLYNWISLKTGEPLTGYVSTVDSGNFVAALMTLAGATPRFLQGVLTDKNVCRGIAELLESCLDEAESDFRVRLREYAQAFSSVEGREAIALTRRFLSDKILQNCPAAHFALSCAEGWLRDADALRFSDALMMQIEAEEDFNLRPLKQFAARFPLSPQDVLALPDLDETLNGLLWQEGRERYAAILDRLRAEYRRLYSYAFSLAESFEKIKNAFLALAEQTDFSCLYDKKRELLYIGRDVDKPVRQNACYDMLLSESRLTSFTAIALGKVPPRHWFRLARPFTRYKNAPLCLSWSGTMFEYLMPELFAKPSPASMLSVSASLACAAQRACASRDGLWGVSESAFAVTDASGEYRYKAFGVPRTALSAAPFERVYAPYATLLALEHAPRAAQENVVRFVENGMAGRYGFFEALDRQHAENGIVRLHMAHHQGMSLCALTNYLCDGFIRASFGANRSVSACSLLWEEKMPLGVLPRHTPLPERPVPLCGEKPREMAFAEKEETDVLLLSGSVLNAFVSSKGETDVYFGGLYAGSVSLYVSSEKCASVSFLPVRDKSAAHAARLEPGLAVFEKHDAGVLWKQEISSSAEDAQTAVSLTGFNETDRARAVRVWFYMRPVLGEKDAFDAHPCFHDLFLSARQENGSLFLTNRKTGLTACLRAPSPARFTSDRAAFLGRGGTAARPAGDFSGGVKQSPVTPCLAAEYEMLLQPGEEKRVTFLLAFGVNAEEAAASSRRLANPAALERMRERARMFAKAYLKEKRISHEEWALSLRLAALALRNPAAIRGEKPKDALWRLSLSDRLPLLTVLCDGAHTARLQSVLRSAFYLRSRGLSFSILLIDDAERDYFDEPFEKTEAILRSFAAADQVRHIRTGEADTDALRRVSFAFLSTAEDISAQLARVDAPFDGSGTVARDNPYPPSVIAPEEGLFDCAYGSFASNGEEYEIRLRTPAPWSNLLVNERFGTLVSESGGGFSWCDNAALNKLTPWSNDPVSDDCGEWVYLRDNHLGRYWSITRDPVDLGDDHTCLFGHGYARYRYNGFGLRQEQTVFVHPTLPVKVWDIILTDLTGRDLSVYFACFPVLGETSRDARFTDVLEEDGMLCARQNGSIFFLYAPGARYASSEHAFFGDGCAACPQAVRRGAFGADGGRALLSLCLKARERVTLYSGYARDQKELAALRRAIDEGDPSGWLDEVRRQWQKRLSRVQIRTPEKKLDLLFNNWLIYQTISSRFLGRCGFYQAGGAYGFRDQLQDCLSLLYVDPDAVRKHILLCAAHQFPEGDVQHWWHPPFSGVRTHISDDLLFLPLLAARYVSHTGDESLWDEVVAYIEGHEPGERDDLYEAARESAQRGTLFEHCLRAVQLVMRRTGQHGLPLILGGDWNDGLNGLGRRGNGESVWLGWFAYHVISCFLPVVREKCPREAESMTAYAKTLVHALNRDGWDGEWFLRAFDDDGRRVGSRENTHCRIDAISQAWATLSGAADADKAKKAMNSVRRELWDPGVLKLLTPPFAPEDQAGYIGFYLPGVRENGGQYTHAACWVASALAQLGEAEDALSLLNMINPVSHCQDKPGAARYRLEPYSVPADVYADGENTGRGGWSWYTASSSLYFCTVLEDLLGVKKENGAFTLRPHIPSSWREYSVLIEEDDHTTEIRVRNFDGKSEGEPHITRLEKDRKTVWIATL